MDWSEPHLLEGAGSILKLPEFIKGKGINKVLVVTDKGLMSLHLLDPMFEKLEEVGIEYVVYDGVQPNPTIPNIEECKDMYVNNSCQGIIAFGGGSPMDCCKAACAIAKGNDVISSYHSGGKAINADEAIPMIAVTTTSGTASEVTNISVLTDLKLNLKNPMNDPQCIRKLQLLTLSLL